MKKSKFSFKRILLAPFEALFVILIYFYRIIISPLIPKTCKFTPTCSKYALLAIKEYGPFKGAYLAARRILRCNPFNKKSGYDPVPLNIKGELKWLL